MPERNTKALRAAIAEHTPQLLTDFDTHWKWAIGDAHDIAPVPAFLAQWWAEFAIARDPALDRHIHDLENRAADATTNAEATQLLTQAAAQAGPRPDRQHPSRTGHRRGPLFPWHRQHPGSPARLPYRAASVDGAERAVRLLIRSRPGLDPLHVHPTHRRPSDHRQEVFWQ
ncbi:hypothetical protein [Streptomyces venezuelae]|uniref:hypothetical protein n=1 Tax=Streptomyces venezuelae TaxID=54571 RepID=UPI002958CB41|nr:hypothetical protein [Streptomyces venezuelae]